MLTQLKTDWAAQLQPDAITARMVKNLKPRVIHGQHISPSGSTYPKEALRVGTLCRFLAGLLQSAVAQLSADPEIGTSFYFLDE